MDIPSFTIDDSQTTNDIPQASYESISDFPSSELSSDFPSSESISDFSNRNSESASSGLSDDFTQGIFESSSEFESVNSTGEDSADISSLESESGSESAENSESGSESAENSESVSESVASIESNNGSDNESTWSNEPDSDSTHDSGSLHEPTTKGSESYSESAASSDLSIESAPENPRSTEAPISTDDQLNFFTSNVIHTNAKSPSPSSKFSSVSESAEISATKEAVLGDVVKRGGGIGIGAIVGIVCGVLAVVAVCAVLTVLFIKKRKSANDNGQKETLKNISAAETNTTKSASEITNQVDDEDADLNFWL